MIFTQAELAAAGWVGPRRIDSLSLNVTNKNSFGSFNMQIRMGCTFISDINNFIPGSLVKKVYENGGYQTNPGINTFKFQTPYVWDGLSNLVVDVCFFNLNPIGVDEIASTSTAPNNQFISATSAFGGCQIPEAPGSSSPLTSFSRPNVEFYACTLPPTAWQYRWSGPYLFDSTVKSPYAYVNDNPSKYVVYTRGGNGCLVWDTVEVTLSNHDVLVSPSSQTLCLNDRVRPIATGIGNQNGQRFRWFVSGNASLSDLSCTDCPTPEITANRVGTNVYNVERTDIYGCLDTATITLEVLPLPNVVITNGDTAVVRFGESLQLLAEGSIRYSWTPSWGMNNPNISSPVIKPTETDLYTVNGLDENGCGNSDAIYIIVDYSRNLFIPTAFSPNGDGNNDRFRIANFGAQRVSEFRVYNRWGQEVFNAKDNRGWDGTFQGAEQGNGTYHYIIKAAFADGEVQTFKGDVVLVR
jgi:gliding motility-associated-like protein